MMDAIARITRIESAPAHVFHASSGCPFCYLVHIGQEARARIVEAYENLTSVEVLERLGLPRSTPITMRLLHRPHH
jgi:hypothetical protein